jgi:hypothetical protein
MSHAHRDDQDLTQQQAREPIAFEPPVKPVVTNTDAARAAAAARKAEEALPPEQARERRFLGDGDTAPARPGATDPPLDEEVDALAARAWGRRGPPPPRFGTHAGQGWWHGTAFEALGFADAPRMGSWIGAPRSDRDRARLEGRAGWIGKSPGPIGRVRS